jgi:uncharacterized protein YkwD
MTNQIPLHEIPPDVPRPPSTSHAPVLRKKKAKKRLVIILIALIVLGSGYWYFQKFFSLPLREIASFGASVGTSIANQAQNFSAPSPLVTVSKGTPKKANTLTDAGIITNTNIQRAQNGNLPALTENATLDDIAALRMDDMFSQQYFAHVGPQGESALTVASSVGYSYLAIGENLALGLYNGDDGVLQAWMNSSGHRANILDPHYTQIGVAVREGVFQGQSTWIAIQVFGRPSSDCPLPDATLQTKINVWQSQIASMNAQLKSEKAAIDAMNPQSGPQYNEQVGEYNNLAAQYNALVAQTQNAITQYDSEATAFNTCLAQ